MSNFALFRTQTLKHFNLMQTQVNLSELNSHLRGQQRHPCVAPIGIDFRICFWHLVPLRCARIEEEVRILREHGSTHRIQPLVVTFVFVLLLQ